jgi:YbbR domain-containing protein
MSKGVYSSLGRPLFHNLGLKLLALVLAVGLWLAVSKQPSAEVAVEVPIAFENMPGNLEISSESIPKAQVRLRGPEQAIRRLRMSDVYVDLRLDGVKPGERTFDLTVHQVHQPRQLQVVQVIPSQVRLAFDIRATRQVPIQPRLVGTFAEGYEIGQVVVEPAAVSIVGPEKRVDAVESATTDPVDITGVMNRIALMRHVYVADPLVQVSNLAPVRITIMMQKVVTKNGS